MFNPLPQMVKFSLTTILLAIIAWIALDRLAFDASANNQYNPLPMLVQAAATATPRIDIALNQATSQGPPTECSLFTLPQSKNRETLNRAMLEALTPPHLIGASLSRAVLGAATIQPVEATIAPIYDDLQQTLSTNAIQTAHSRRTLGTCTVTTPADSGSGTLRQCLLDITANGTITFDAQVFPPSAPTTIFLSSVLPGIRTDGLTIDGTTAGVVLDGTGLTSDRYGLGIDGANGVTIKGLQIVNFPGAGIIIAFGASNNVIGGNDAQARNIIGGNHVGIAIGESSSNNKVIGNYIGTDASGTTARRNVFGVGLVRGPQNNVIGGAGSEGNLISGNEIGVHIEGTHNNFVLGNLIGTDATGTTALGNEFGVSIRLGAQNNTIGGAAQGAGNIISGNTRIGIQIQDGGTNDNQVLGNFIGTDISGHTRLDNEVGVGIRSDDNSQEIGPTNNLIGGANEGARNIISGNVKNGINIVGPMSSNNRIEGNYIGTNVSGTASVGNESGIVIGGGAHHNTIGGIQPGTRNLISGNDVAIGIKGSESLMTTDNLVQGNYIGTDVSGTAALPNYEEGIIIRENAHRNTIGGSSKQARNIISGNQNSGVSIAQEGTPQRGASSVTENQVLGNYIGTDVTGQVALPNQWGVTLHQSQNNIVGCEELEGCNIISGNSEAGIMIQEEASDNQVMGNFIGTNADGTSPLANGMVGIGIIKGAHHNIIGGNTEGTRNVISGNRQAGVDIRKTNTSNNQVVGNYIGTDKSGTSALPNRWGVAILEDAHHNIIGGNTEGTRNLISGNSDAGVQLQGHVEGGDIPGASADHNRVQGNYIGTDVTGLQPLGNRWGINILGEAKNNLIGGTEEGEGNLISGNLESGIEILNYLDLALSATFKTKSNQIQGNLIGVGADGSSALGNGFAGICLFLGTSSNTIGPGNTIAHNADAGVRIQDDLILTPPVGNTITQNVIHQNDGLPIDFIEPLIPLNPPPTPPTLSNWSGNAISGSACAGCRIEIFANPDTTPAGTEFLVAGSADTNGDFTITLPIKGPANLSCLSATATDQNGTTFEFSNSLCSGDPPIATTTPTVSNSPTATLTPTAPDSTATPTAPDSTATPTAPDSTATATATAVNASHTLYLPLVIR